MRLLIKRLYKDAKLPTKTYADDAGFDLYSRKKMVLKPNKPYQVPTGIAIVLPKETVGLIWDKSGLSHKYALKVLGGVIDEGYRGEILVGIINLGEKEFLLNKGEKIAQLLIQPILNPLLQEIDRLPPSPRFDKGFGSSGRK